MDYKTRNHWVDDAQAHNDNFDEINENNLAIDSTDYNREWLQVAKIIQFFRVLFQKKSTELLDYVEEFEQIKFDEYLSQWKRAIILDIDECVAPHHGNILEKNEEIIKRLILQWWKIIVYSNMQKSDRYSLLEELWIHVVTCPYGKPDKRWFQYCLDYLWVEWEETIMIGDNYLTDGWCKQLSIDFVKVKPIAIDYTHFSVAREAQKYFREYIDKKALKRGHINKIL